MKPPKVYIHERVYNSELSRNRLERMMDSIETDCVQVVDDAVLSETVKMNGWLEYGAKRTGEIGRKSDPAIIFNNFQFLPTQDFVELKRKYPALSGYNLLGDGAWTYRNAENFRKGGGVCKSAYEIHSAWGCYHACDYCHVKDFFVIMLNLEEFVEHLDDLVRRENWQKLYKYDNQTDTICLEPEYGASELLVKYFSEQDDKYLMLYTKSDNVDHLLNLPHNGKTIVNWTLSCETVAREIEKKSPSTTARIEAAAKCQEAGYTVRFRFSPIIPVGNWREENRDMIEQMFSMVKPDLITMDILGWMDAVQIKNCMDISLFDDEYRNLVELMIKEGFTKRGKQIFPQFARLKIYHFFMEEIRRISEKTPIAICMETKEMWDELSDRLGMTMSNYACCCGPLSVPGHPMLLS
jgi:spore photoproduct lyase